MEVQASDLIVSPNIYLSMLYFFLISCVFCVVYVSSSVCVSERLKTVIDCIVNCSYKKKIKQT